MSWYYKKDETKKEEIKKDLEETKLPQFFSLLESILKENDGGDGYFVGKKVRHDPDISPFIFHIKQFLKK